MLSEEFCDERVLRTWSSCFRGRVDSQKCVLHLPHYDPTQWFSLPIWGLSLGKRQGLECTAPAGDQVSQHSACEVGGRDTLARVTAGEPDTGRGIESVARHADRTSPRMGELDPFQHRRQYDSRIGRAAGPKP